MSITPRTGYATKAKVIKVIDGDTIKVEVVRHFNVRLLDIDVDELNTGKGRAAKEFLEHLINDKEITVFIPNGRSELNLMDINSFNRLLGEIWLDGDINLMELLKFYGYDKK